MAVTRTQVYNQFLAGLITEAGPLTFPENASADELNCILDKKQKRRRRLGVDYEDGYTLSTANPTTATVRDKAIDQEVWTSVAGDGNLNFLVLQVDTTVYFYDLSEDPLGGGLKGFTINLSTYAAAGATDIGSEHIQTSSGKGLLFIVSKKIDPIYVEYDPVGDSITVTAQTLQIRDFDGLTESPALTPSEEPASLSTTHEYNLKNQGWLSPGTGVNSPLTDYFTAKGVYPPNSKQWWTGKDASENFDSALLAKFSTGNALAPRGHYLLNPFYKDRSTASGVAGIAVESETYRPEVVAFFAGRVWYFGVDSSLINGHCFFSQVVTAAGKASLCYQEADPTSEDLNELLDSDGGVIVIPEIGRVLSAVVSDKSLFILASNGVWVISGSGSDEGFKATNFSVSKVGGAKTSVGLLGHHSVVETEGFPFWWSSTGIYTLAADQVSGKLFPSPVTDKSIRTFYQDIPALSKVYAKGIYDPANKRVYWLYASTAPSSDEYRWKYDRLLIYETETGAFYPWSISSLNLNSPWLTGVFNTAVVSSIERTEQLADSSGDTLIDGSSNAVVADIATISGNNTFLKWLAMVPDGASGFNWVFCEFANGDFVDWESKDSTGAAYTSYLLTGYEMAQNPFEKQAPLILVYLEKTETAVAAGALVNPSSLFMQLRWEWTDDGDAGKWSELKQVYKLKREFDTGLRSDINTGYPVIVAKVPYKGRGRAVQAYFESEAGKDFVLLGWQVMWDDKQGV